MCRELPVWLRGVSFCNKKPSGESMPMSLPLRQRLKDGLEALGAAIFGGEGPSVGVLSFNLPGIDSRELAFILDDQYSICVRGGLHCSPRSHQALGTTGARCGSAPEYLTPGKR